MGQCEVELKALKDVIIKEKIKLLVSPEVLKATQVIEKQSRNKGLKFNFLEEIVNQDSLLGGLAKEKVEDSLALNAMYASKPVNPRAPSPGNLDFRKGGRIEKRASIPSSLPHSAQATGMLQNKDNSNHIVSGNPPSRGPSPSRDKSTERNSNFGQKQHPQQPNKFSNQNSVPNRNPQNYNTKQGQNRGSFVPENQGFGQKSGNFRGQGNAYPNDFHSHGNNGNNFSH